MRLCLAVVLVGCGTRIPPVPSKGGPVWLEVQSEHFTVWTDASESRGRELVRKMEHLRQVVRGMAFPDLPAQGRSFVVAFADSYELGAYIPNDVRAYAMPTNPLLLPVIVLAADSIENYEHVVTHELTHVISAELLHHQPRWFAEGLARFFESVKLDADKAVVDVGEPLPDNVTALSRRRPRPAEEVWNCSTFECADDRFYAGSWAIIAYLANTRPAEMARYLRRFAELGDERLAWAEVFPDLDAHVLDGAVLQWLLHGTTTVWHYRVALQEWPVTVRKLADADVYAARGLVGLTFHSASSDTRADVDAALSIEPTNVIAYIANIALGHEPSPDEIAALTQAHPDDFRAWVLLAGTTGNAAERASAIHKACELAAPNPAARVPYSCK